MFFIHSMGRRSNSDEVETLDDLGEIVTKRMASKTYDAINVSVGLTDAAVMPYVWIRRNDEDNWEGEAGDSIKLGIDDGLLIETDPIQMLNLNEAIRAGIATVMDDGRGPTVTIHDEPVKTQSKKTNEELVVESKRMINKLFSSLREDDHF